MPSPKTVRIVAVGLLSASLLLASATADASGRRVFLPKAVIDVYPGPNALADALAAANPGDVLLIHAGTYPEHVTITTPDLTLKAAGDGRVTVDAGCQAGTTILVRAEGTGIRGIWVTGAAEGFGGVPIEVNFWGVGTGMIARTSEVDTCDAEYGINVYRAGSIKVTGNRTSGFGDSGIYVGAITSTPNGPLVVRSNETFGNDKGVIIEDSAGGTIRVGSNDVHDNTSSGIYVTNSDGVSVADNSVTDDGQTGIELDATSDSNLVEGNTSLGDVYDLSNDGGTGNCFLGNVYQTSFGDIGC